VAVGGEKQARLAGQRQARAVKVPGRAQPGPLTLEITVPTREAHLDLGTFACLTADASTPQSDRRVLQFNYCYYCTRRGPATPTG
jgi:hypothetical protein